MSTAALSNARVGRSYPAGQRLATVAVPRPYYERDPAMLGNALTPARLSRLLLDRNQGYFQGWFDLADEMRRNNPHLHSQLALREQSLVETEFVVLPGKGSNQQAARRAAAASEELIELWQRLPDDDEVSGWDTWLAEFVAAKYYLVGLHEILWARDGREVKPVALARISERRLSFAAAPHDPAPWTLRIWDQDDPSGPFGASYGLKVRDFHPDKFLVHLPRVLGGPRTTEGLFSALVWICLFNVWSWRDLMALCEMIGRPPVVATYSAGGAKADGELSKFNGTRTATKEEIAAAKRTVQAVSGALRAVLPDTIRLEALKVALPTAEPVQLLTSREAHALMSKVINAVDSVSDLKPGARAAVETQERTSATPYRADCRSAQRLLNALLARYVRANPDVFGADCPAPVVQAKTEGTKDRKAVLDGIAAAQERGLEVAEEWAYREANIPPPRVVRGVKEKLLKPLARPALAAAAAPPAASADGAPPPTTVPETPAAKE